MGKVESGQVRLDDNMLSWSKMGLIRLSLVEFRPS